MVQTLKHNIILDMIEIFLPIVAHLRFIRDLQASIAKYLDPAMTEAVEKLVS